MNQSLRTVDKYVLSGMFFMALNLGNAKHCIGNVRKISSADWNFIARKETYVKQSVNLLNCCKRL